MTNIADDLKNFLLMCTSALNPTTNEQNRIKVYDFKVVTKQVDISTWELTLYGPDMEVFTVHNEQNQSEDHKWIVSPKSYIIPWYIRELPPPIMLFLMQWWMRILGWKQWMNSQEKPKTYNQLLN